MGRRVGRREEGGKIKWWKGGTAEGGKKKEKVGSRVGRREEGGKTKWWKGGGGA